MTEEERTRELSGYQVKLKGDVFVQVQAPTPQSPFTVWCGVGVQSRRQAFRFDGWESR